MSRAATSVGEVAARGPACAGLARRGARVSALFGGSGRRRGRQTLGLVLYLSGDLLEFRLELAAVVGAEEQFSAAEQDDAQVCLGATAVAAIGGRQRARGGQNSRDRKSTRLNSSHVKISYAVF